MTNTPPPTDDSHLHAGPADLARLMDRMAEEAFQNGRETMVNACMQSATRYRRMAERGEREPRF